MRKRDVSIQRAAETFADNKLRIREKTQHLDARAKFLENEQANNREMEGKIVFAERSLAKQKQSLDAESARTKEMNEEVELLRNSLSSAATDLAMQRSTNAQSREDLDSKKRKVEAARKRVAAVVRKLQTEFAALDTLEKRTKELSEMYSVEEGRLRTAQKDVAELKDLQFKTSQELYQLRIQERDLAAEINGGQAQAKNLAEKIRNLDGDMVKQQEVLYAAEFQIQALERKVARAAGERSDQEKRELTTKINQLQAILDDKSSEHAMLTAQVKKSEEDLLAARRRGEDCQKEVSLLNGKIAELTLESDTAVRTVKTAVREKEDKMVAHDILKLEVKRLTDILNFRADEVYGLENRKYQLQMAMEERKHEIEVLHEGLRAHLKSALEDIHRSTLEKKERGLRVAKLQAKYEVLLGKVKKEEGEEHSQAYYVIRAAQEREALQREGDLLDSQIRQAEREVRALEATLHNLNERNLMYRDSFKVGGSAEAAAEQAALRQRLDKAFDRLKFKRSEESSLVQDLEQFESRLGNIEREEEQIGGQLDDLQRRADLAGRDWQEQIEKTKRAVSRLERLRKSVRDRLGPEKAAKFEEEVLLAELRETTRIALLEIRAAINEDPSVGVLVEAAVVGAGLRLPSGTTSGTSSRSSTRSGGGSVASNVSGRSVSSRGSIASRGSVASNASTRGGIGAQSQGSRASSRAPSVRNMELNFQR